MVWWDRNFILLVYGLMLLSAGAVNGATLDKTNMKSEDQSLVNKVSSAGAMGATGYGVSQYLQGRAEQSADQDADQDMRAYLETFRCGYGDGLNIKGGQNNIQLPGGNELAVLAAEYIKLASSIKQRKEALGLKPGIESQVIIDIASSGLYDDVGAGRGDGAFASVSRALNDPNGRDAARIRAQSADSRDKAASGVDIALGGVILGASAGALGKIMQTNGANMNGARVNGGQSGIMNNFSGATGGPRNNSGVNGMGADMDRLMAACDALRSDISVQADNIYNDILAVQSSATDAEIDTIPIDAAITRAETAKSAIANAAEKAEAELAAAQKLVQPSEPDASTCEDEYKGDKPQLPDESDYEEDDTETYQKDMADYNRELKKYEDKVAACQKKSRAQYDKDAKKFQADMKRYADEAVRQQNIGRTELGKMQTALSDAETAKTRAIAAKEQTAAKEAADAKKQEELQRQISDRADLVKKSAAQARDYYDAARDIIGQINMALVLDEEQLGAQEQVDKLKAYAEEDLDAAKAAMESAEKQIKIAMNASTVKEADAAVAEAARQAEIAHKRQQSIAAILEKIKDAKLVAQNKYLQEQQDSEGESAEETEEE